MQSVRLCCVISSFITKPQLFNAPFWSALVALYPLSSPNHNWTCAIMCGRDVALYPLSSPNHNSALVVFLLLVLRYILFHHQTTTYNPGRTKKAVLRYILFHHQTTTCRCSWNAVICCVISSFITKPQHTSVVDNISNVALYPLSSPNHNYSGVSDKSQLLRYILFHHQTTTY